jgi:hypothetical protein
MLIKKLLQLQKSLEAILNWFGHLPASQANSDKIISKALVIKKKTEPV